MNNRILILGAGNAQIDLIERCRDLGLEVHGVSYSDADSGVPLFHHFEQIDIVDVDSVAAYIRRHDIGHIYSVGSDIAVPTICEAARRTGLNCFIAPQTAQTCCSKRRMRAALSLSPYQMEHVICRAPSDAKGISFYPVMMKPVDSQGQRGVFLCRSYDDVLSFFERSIAHSRCGELILERYIPGDEVSLSGYVINGQLVFGLLSDRESFSEYPGGIVKGHRLPSRYAGTEAEKCVWSLAREAIERLHILNGPVYFQIKIDGEQPYLLEVTPRLDGCHLWRLIQLYTGVDLLGMALAHLLTGRAQVPAWYPLLDSARMEFICRAPGEAFIPEPPDEAAVFSRLYYRAGETVRRINGVMEKCGYRMYAERKRVALIGGSGMIGRSMQHFCADRFEMTDVSRGGGLVASYDRRALSRAVSGCGAAVILAAKKAAGAEDEDFSINVRIAREAMRACHEAGVKTVVYLSTRCVYSRHAPAPCSEDALVDPINAYGASKLEAERLCMALGEELGIRVVVLRLAQVLCAEEAGTAFSVFLSRALRGEALTVYGQGKGARDYVYVGDACRAIALALLRPDARGVYNIGSGAPTTIAQLARATAAAAGTGAQVLFREDIPEDNAVSFLCIDRARRELGYRPQYALEDAVKACVVRRKRERKEVAI